MTATNPRKSFLQISGACLLLAAASAIMGFLFGQYGIAFYVASVLSLIFSIICMVFARKCSVNMKSDESSNR